MIQTKVVVRTKEELEPAFPEINEQNFAGEGELHGVAILESGMGSGKTSVGFAIKTTEGKYIMVQTSAAILDTLYHCYVGAEQRFADIKSKKN